MSGDPFGNLCDWGTVIETLDSLAANGQLAKCQDGVVRVLRFRGNWRLREEALKRIGGIAAPSAELVRQVNEIIHDDNLYYEVRILAANVLVQFMKRNSFVGIDFLDELKSRMEELIAVPQPPYFMDSLKLCLDAMKNA